ncbi:MAG TPA: FAD-binding oxidoreductase [Acidimicrobiales bacterium]
MTSVVVVGGGIAGASAAWALAAGGADVALVEQELQPGHHATGRSAAVTNETVGHPVVGALARAGRPFLEDPPPGFVDHPLLAPRGLLWVAEDPAALDALASAGSVAAGPGPAPARRVGPDEVRRLVPELRPEWAAAGGVHEPDARSIDVAALLQGYLRGLRRRGGRVRTGCRVTGLARDATGWTLTVAVAAGGDGDGRADGPAERLRCDVVVDAAGAWGDVVAAQAGVRPVGLAPLRRTACIVAVPAGHDVARWPLVMDAGGTFYAEPEPGGLLLSPADETPTDPGDARPDELDVALALDRLRAATTLPVRSVRRAWAGLRTFAPDRVPVAGFAPDAPGFYWLVGQGGGGIKTAPALAALAAADILGAPLDLDLPDGAVAALRPR